ncbi:MAG TPA: hypothetical protein VLB49_08145 [Gemmatimonadales bacterium]|nr:hypothetical protein [Gemmatimonadales bacterium]
MVRRFGICHIALLGLCVNALRGQDTLPPTQGGYVHSLGLPAIHKPFLGIGLGLSRNHTSHLAAQFRAGVFKDIGSPVTELAGWSVEGFAGVRDLDADYGARAFLLSHLFGLGAGVEYDVHDGRGSPLLLLVAPMRRGGLLGSGSDLRLEWLSARGPSFNVAVSFPVGQPHRGRTRPMRDFVHLTAERPRPLAFLPADSALRDALTALREHALWINRFTVPDLGGLSSDPARAATDAVAPLKTHLATGSVDAEIRGYRHELVRAFSIAAAGTPVSPGDSTSLGAAAAASATAILLDRVIFPYNRLIGQPKKRDSTREFGSHARGVFARWLTMSSRVAPERDEACLYVFQHLLDVVEEIRAVNRRTWGNSALVWLPLQLALVPEEYDEQTELDSIISRAVGHSVTHGNRIWYVLNDRFQRELEKSIANAEDYHILWIHDFRGLNDAGKPDRLSLLTATQAYLAAMCHRLGTYDSTGRLPVYMIFLDQHYFEKHKSRGLLRFLEDPLGRRPGLPAGFDSLAHELAAAQQHLWEAVNASRLLTAERAQYGESWLHRLVKVHVSVTNPADPAFRSRQMLPLVGIPDDMMRDHRKAVLYDVSEADPYRGMAMYAGMGVGEHYVGPTWEDRAIMLQGPVALTLRDEARALLASQGIRGGDVPHVLRPSRRAPDYDRLVQAVIDSMDAWGGVATRAIELENETGFGRKEISVADATLFSLLAPGSVMKIPDSLWLNELLASLFVGSALRGARVLIIAPSLASAPGKGWPTLALMHDLMSRLVALQHALAPEYARVGGFVRAGLYDPKAGVHDLFERVNALRDNLIATPFLRELYSFDPTVLQVLSDSTLTAKDSTRRAPVTTVQPLLHMKGFLYISREAWARLISGPPMAYGLREYLKERQKQLEGGEGVGEEPMADALQLIGSKIINTVLDSLPDSARACPRPQHCPGLRWVFYLQIGSPNQDYRSMVMDGEAATLVTSWTALYGMPDFVLLTGLAAWPETQAQLDRLLPPPDSRLLAAAWWIRMSL